MGSILSSHAVDQATFVLTQIVSHQAFVLFFKQYILAVPHVLVTYWSKLPLQVGLFGVCLETKSIDYSLLDLDSSPLIDY